MSPEVGQTWIVAASPTGLFEGHAQSLAGWTADGWRFFAPLNGVRVFDKENAAFRLYRDGWQRTVAPSAPAGGTIVDTEARAVIAVLVEKLVDAGVFATS